MSDASFYQRDVTNGFESERACVIQKCLTPAEHKCLICMKRYCDEHYRSHFHFDEHRNGDLR